MCGLMSKTSCTTKCFQNGTWETGWCPCPVAVEQKLHFATKARNELPLAWSKLSVPNSCLTRTGPSCAASLCPGRNPWASPWGVRTSSRLSCLPCTRKFQTAFSLLGCADLPMTIRHLWSKPSMFTAMTTVTRSLFYLPPWQVSFFMAQDRSGNNLEKKTPVLSTLCTLCSSYS